MGLKLGWESLQLYGQCMTASGVGWVPTQTKLSQQVCQKAWKARLDFVKLEKWRAKSHGWNTQTWHFEAYTGQPGISKILKAYIELQHGKPSKHKFDVHCKMQFNNSYHNHMSDTCFGNTVMAKTNTGLEAYHFQAA